MFQYFTFLFLLVCCELAVSIGTLVYREQHLSGLEARLTDQLATRYGHDTNNNNGFTQSIDVAQFKVPSDEIRTVIALLCKVWYCLECFIIGIISSLESGALCLPTVVKMLVKMLCWENAFKLNK
jgi:hypothetical protein